uniref:LisH domain-containing protein n=1 Tax=Mesocestoides corti TaxID=53468 RepID=A0A5K3EVN7_MESCO
MSDVGQDADLDESDLKECLLETLKADGTIKKLQDQLSAAVYSAFYHKTAPDVDRVPSPLSTLISDRNGIAAVSLLVDFLRTLNLSKTLKVLIHEACISDLQFEQRDELSERYHLPAVPSTEPLLSSLLDSVRAPPLQLSKAVVLDQDSENELEGPVQNNGDRRGRNKPSWTSSPPPVVSHEHRNQHQSPPCAINSTDAPDVVPQMPSDHTKIGNKASDSLQQIPEPGRVQEQDSLRSEAEEVDTDTSLDDRSISIAEDDPLSASSTDDRPLPTSGPPQNIAASSSHGGFSSTTNQAQIVYRPPSKPSAVNGPDGDSDIDSESTAHRIYA